jgi:6-phosphogluconolactonase
MRVENWQLLEDAEAVAHGAARLIAEAAAEAIARHGEFRLVLAGGTTPLAAYRELADTRQDWARWRTFYGDERCLPPDDPERNSRMALETGLTNRVGHDHPIPAELGAEQAAAAYAQAIAHVRPFDLVILGMGEDGHTASLFPGHDWGNDAVLAVHDAPKPPPERVSLGPAVLQDCRQLLVLVTGEGKREAVQAWQNGTDLPVARVSAVPQAVVLMERLCQPSFTQDTL